MFRCNPALAATQKNAISPASSYSLLRALASLNVSFNHNPRFPFSPLSNKASSHAHLPSHHFHSICKAISLSAVNAVLLATQSRDVPVYRPRTPLCGQWHYDTPARHHHALWRPPTHTWLLTACISPRNHASLPNDQHAGLKSNLASRRR